MAQRFANCVWVVITQYGKIGNLVRGLCRRMHFPVLPL